MLASRGRGGVSSGSVPRAAGTPLKGGLRAPPPVRGARSHVSPGPSCREKAAPRKGKTSATVKTDKAVQVNMCESLQPWLKLGRVANAHRHSLPGGPSPLLFCQETPCVQTGLAWSLGVTLTPLPQKAEASSGT